jgi:CRISPR-associated protein Csd1
MILQALTRYYEILAADPESGIALVGYSAINASFALNLSPQGELLDVLPLFETAQRGKKTVEVPRRLIVPQQTEHTVAISSNFICDNNTYVLGLTNKVGKDPKAARLRFEDFKCFNLKILDGVESPAAKAVTIFLQTYDPEKGAEHPAIKKHLEEIMNGCMLVFKLDGSEGFVHEDLAVRRTWESYKFGKKAEFTGQCLVTGETVPIARLHDGLKNIKGANATGANLVSFNERAYESYGRFKGQGLNAPISEKAMFAYTTAINYLLAGKNGRNAMHMGDATVVFWAESHEKTYEYVIQSLFEPEQAKALNPDEYEQPGPLRDAPAERLLGEIAERLRRGAALDVTALPTSMDANTRFYVLGLSPNSARISVRFFQQDPFLKMVQKMMAHYTDMQIVKEYPNQPSFISPYRILDETISKKSRDKKGSPLLGGVLMRAILNNQPYPAALYYSILNRIHADADDSTLKIYKINYVRAAVIKAYLTRKYRRSNQSTILEVLSMTLNEQSTNQAYLLGRLFAVLEKAQQEAVPGANATIKDRYFTSACASPATVFPVLLRLSQHHISKAEYGYVNDRRIEGIMSHLDVEDNPIPAHLTLDEQGIFILGYYHQRAAFYVPRNNKNTTEPIPTESN